MHCATCEAFIETVATQTEGVSAASASYVTDTVRIDHDPDAVSTDDLSEAVSGLGYSAYDRDDAFSRRQADNMATARLAVGVLVGMAVMLQYIVIIYPTYFAFPFYNERTLEYLNQAMASSSGTYFFIVIAVLTTVVLFITGKPILRGAYVSAKTRSPNMDLLVAIAAVSAYAYSTLAVIFVDSPSIYYDVTVAIIVIVTVGNHYEDSIKKRATELLSDLTAVQVDSARRLVGGGESDGKGSADSENAGETEEVAIDDLASGDRLLVRAGERIPVDGEAVAGDAAVDESVITGESMPVRKTPGDAVVGGSVVADGSLTVEVGPDATSSLDRVAELVWDLQSGNHGVQKLADRLATIFVPVVLAVALLAAGANLALGNGVTEAMLVGLTVLIVSCPCALGLATPLAVAAGIRDALERSIVIFDDTVFERLRGADTVVFDKTGTLTTGEMRVVAADLDDGLLRLAAALEERSAHPVGRPSPRCTRAMVLPKTPAPYRIPTPRRPRSPTAGWQSRQSPTIPSPSPTSRVTLAGSPASSTASRSSSGTRTCSTSAGGRSPTRSARPWRRPATWGASRSPSGATAPRRGSSWSATNCAKDGRRPSPRSPTRASRWSC